MNKKDKEDIENKENLEDDVPAFTFIGLPDGELNPAEYGLEKMGKFVKVGYSTYKIYPPDENEEEEKLYKKIIKKIRYML